MALSTLLWKQQLTLCSYRLSGSEIPASLLEMLLDLGDQCQPDKLLLKRLALDILCIWVRDYRTLQTHKRLISWYSLK